MPEFADAINAALSVTEAAQEIHEEFPNASGTDRAFIAHLIVRHGMLSDRNHMGRALDHVTVLRSEHKQLHAEQKLDHKHQ